MHFVKIGLPLDIMSLFAAAASLPALMLSRPPLPLQICFRLRGVNSINMAILTRSINSMDMAIHHVQARALRTPLHPLHSQGFAALAPAAATHGKFNINLSVYVLAIKRTCAVHVPKLPTCFDPHTGMPFANETLRRHHQRLLRLNLVTPKAMPRCFFLCHPFQMPLLPHPTWAHRPTGQTAEQGERLNACAALALHSTGALLQATHTQQTLASPRHAAPASAHPLHNYPWTSPGSEQDRTCPRVRQQQQRQQQQHERSAAQGAALGCICAGLEREGRGHALEVKIPPAHAEFERAQHNARICTTKRRDRCLQTMPYQLNLASLKNA